MGVNNFRNTRAMRLSVFSKCSKFNVDTNDAIKNEENPFSFPNKFIWTGSEKLSVLLGEYS